MKKSQGIHSSNSFVLLSIWYQSLVLQEVLGSNYLSTIYSSFVDLKVHKGLYLVCLTLPCASMELHVREGVKGMIFILNPNHTSMSF